MPRAIILFFLWAVIILLIETPHTFAEDSAWTKVDFPAVNTTAIAATPWGIVVGEKDPNSYNGLQLSRDFGNTWSDFGLKGRGITNLLYTYNKLYATTFNEVDGTNGLFVYDATQNSWRQIGPIISAEVVARDSNTIYLGGNIYGLWVSKDEGLTWSQKIGYGWFGPEIKTILSAEGITIVFTSDKAYASNDHGDNWNEIPFFRGKSVVSAVIANGKMIAGGPKGMYQSQGTFFSWTDFNWVDLYAVQKLYLYDDVLYISKNDYGEPLPCEHTIMQTSTLATPFYDTNLNYTGSEAAVGIAGVYGEQQMLFAIIPNVGIYKYVIPKKQMVLFQFLNIPWKTDDKNELIDNITSYFDHEYPLLDYAYFKEPASVSDSTVTYQGIRGKKPDVYYSSHNGIDFKLPYGTEVDAAASGYAEYYTCDGCGNAIQIDHQNGYRTIYMHLQKDGLITTNPTFNVWVDQGEQIGKVGLTGNTDGPHLHFEVMGSNRIYQTFTYPDELTDPFGWQDAKNPDPWEIFKWTDSLGRHSGNASAYLWNYISPSSTETFLEGGNISTDNKSFSFDNTVFATPVTVTITNSSAPSDFSTQSTLKYIKDTAIDIQAYLQSGERVSLLNSPATITINLGLLQLTNVKSDSLKLYTFNETTKQWDEMPSILDLTNNTITGIITHLSKFAVFGDVTDADTPQTSITVAGQLVDDWYISQPLVYLSANKSTSAIYYTTNGETDWQQYSDPIPISKEGITNFQYRSVDTYGNVEPTQNYVLQVNTKDRWTKKIKVNGASFSVGKG